MSHQTELTVLCDNHASDELLCEHGLSILIRGHGLRILFDTGSGETLLHNAGVLGINMADISHVVLSHGHYDHTGGLDAVLRHNQNCVVMAHPESICQRYSLHDDQPPREIGIQPAALAALQHCNPERLHYSARPVMLSTHIGLSGAIPRHYDIEDTGGPFFLDREGRYPDLLPDDQALWIRTPRGLLIIPGCGHAGLANTVDYVCQLAGEQRIYGIIGGFHLLHASQQRLDFTFAYLRDRQPEFICPGHCTGDHVIEQMNRELPGISVGRLYAGKRIRPHTGEETAAV